MRLAAEDELLPAVVCADVGEEVNIRIAVDLMHKANLVRMESQHDIAVHLRIQRLRHAYKGILCHRTKSCLTE